MQKKSNKNIRLFLQIATFFMIFVMSVLVLPINSSAQINSEHYIPYQTYSYDYNGNAVATPHAYIPDKSYSGFDMGTGELSSPSDMVTDKDCNIYIADTGNNRIIKLDSEYNLKFEISEFITDQGPDSLNGPRGLFVSDDEKIYVADTDNGRIAVFDKKGNFLSIIAAPNTSLLPKDYTYSPTALVVDRSNGVYVVADGSNMGLMHFSPQGKFTGFIGAQKVTFSPVEYLWKSIMSQAQRERMEAFVPTEYNNIVLDERGFFFVTTSAVEQGDFVNAIRSRSTDSKGTPVRCINTSGDDVLTRQGYFPPVGDVNYNLDETGNLVSSVIEDVAIGPNGSYTLMDTRNSRLFTYSQTGNLLYAFSDVGMQIGNSLAPASITYKDSQLLLLDRASGLLTIFNRTEYGDLIHKADGLYSDFEFDASIPVWNEVLQENSNYDIAYDGIGNSLMRTGDFKGAMKYYVHSNNIPAYSRAFREQRNQTIEKFAYLVPIILVSIVLGIIGLFSYIGKRNTAVKYAGKQKTKSDEFFYGFYILTHPFDGFWDMKRESRGSVFGATLTLILTIGTLVAQQSFSGTIFQSEIDSFNPIGTVAMILIPLLLWTVVNWSVTTLMDGKWSIKDIYMATAYALLPIVILVLPTIPLSYILSMEESLYISMLQNFAIIWAVFLIFSGNLSIHEYTAKKSIGSILLTILGIGVVLFIVLMIFATYQRIFSFGNSIYKEIIYRQ